MQHSDTLNNNSSNFHSDRPQLELMFQLSRKINASLDLSQQLSIFYEHLVQSFSIDSMSYQNHNPNLNIEHHFGSEATQNRHECQYKLVLEEEELGTIHILRKQRFEEKDNHLIESLLSILVIPVRNALQYYSALQQANTDALTGVNNRQSFDLTIERELKLAKRNFFKMSLLLIDVDNFKTINDSLGHQAGDKALKVIADGIRNSTRDTDRIFRYGGDEFVVLLDNTDEFRARLVSERIRMCIEEQQSKKFDCPLHVTIGTATLLPHDCHNSLFARADLALYQAKNHGKNCVVTSLDGIEVTHQPPSFNDTGDFQTA